MNSLNTLIKRFREKAALNMTFIGMTAALCFLAWLGNSYLQSRLKDIARCTAERESMLERKEALQTSSRQLKEKLGSVKAVLATLQAKLPPIPEESQFLQELSKRASAAEVSLSEFRPGGITKRPDCKEIELRLRATGQYPAVCRWLNSLGEVPRFVRISNITFAGPPTPGGSCIVDIQLNLLFGLIAQPELAAVVKP
jgi:Tfp pilus assembly protein PilO